jgi:hypothetical protein
MSPAVVGLLAAAGRHEHALGALVAAAVVAGLLWLGGYAVACLLFPFAACRRCGGDGKLRSASGRTFRLCPRCGGTGRRVRVGRIVIDHLRRTRDAAR